MKSKLCIIALIMGLSFVFLLIFYKNIGSDNMIEEKEIKLIIDNKELIISLENNSSSKALIEKLKKSNIIVEASDYGNFEKVGNLGFDLPTNDKKITTIPGDIILYQGNQISIYYDTNTWTFTKLGHIKKITQEELKEILDKENLKMELSLIKDRN